MTRARIGAGWRVREKLGRLWEGSLVPQGKSTALDLEHVNLGAKRLSRQMLQMIRLVFPPPQ